MDTGLIQECTYGHTSGMDYVVIVWYGLCGLKCDGECDLTCLVKKRRNKLVLAKWY